MKISAFILLCLFLNAGILKSQEIAASGGDYFKTTNGSLSITIGEPVIETFVANEHILTQGFQQNLMFLVIGVEDPENMTSFSIFPNPVKNKLKIRIDNGGDQKISYSLSTMKGKIISKGQFEPVETELEVGQLPSGTYLLKLITDQRVDKVYKVVKL